MRRLTPACLGCRVASDAKLIELSSRLRIEYQADVGTPTRRPDKPLGVGLYPGFDQELYFADPCDVPSLTQSTAKTILESSAEYAWYNHPRLGGYSRPPKPAYDRGHLVHALLLGKGADFRVIYADDFKTQSARDDRDQAYAEKLIPVLEHKAAEAIYIVRRVNKRLADIGVDLCGDVELAAVWKDESTEGDVLCRGMIDHFDVAGGYIDDIKTTDRVASVEECAKNMVNFGADIQACAYTNAIASQHQELLGRLKFRFIYIEMSGLFGVTVVTPDGAMEELGSLKWNRAKAKWAKCLRENKWPGHTDRVTPVSPPNWAMNRELEA